MHSRGFSPLCPPRFIQVIFPSASSILGDFRGSSQLPSFVWSVGEELIDFWLVTERLLGLSESEGSQRELFLSLLLRLRATHLREGSSVVTLCTTTLGKSHRNWG